MSFPFPKAAAVAATAALAISGATGVAGAQESSLPEGSIGAYGSSPDSGSLLQPVDATGVGSLDTANTSLGEPTSGSLSGLNTAINGSLGFSNPAPGTGSVDTTGSLLGEPTTGSLASVWSPVSDSLGTNEGITTILSG